MTGPLSFVRLDLRSQTRLLLTIAAFGPLFGFFTRTPYVVTPMYLFVGMSVVSTLFSITEKAGLDTLYATLPVSRRSVVLGRYLTIVALYAVLVALSEAVTRAMALVLGKGVEPGVLTLIAAGSFATLALITAVQLPFYFALGFTRARLVSTVPVFLPAAVVGAVVGLGIPTKGALARLVADPSLLWAVGGAAAGLGFLAVSSLISQRLYAAREL